MIFSEDEKLRKKYSGVTNSWVIDKIARDIGRDDIEFPILELKRILELRKDDIPGNSLKSQTDLIISCLEMGEIHDLYKKMNYNYYNVNSGEHFVPSAEYLENKIRYELDKVYNHPQHPYRPHRETGNGRILAERDIENGYILLSVKIIPIYFGLEYTERSINLDHF